MEALDTGDAGNWPLYPVTSLRLGDTNERFEYIDFRVGPLVCKQGKKQNIVNGIDPSLISK